MIDFTPNGKRMALIVLGLQLVFTAAAYFIFRYGVDGLADYALPAAGLLLILDLIASYAVGNTITKAERQAK